LSQGPDHIVFMMFAVIGKEAQGNRSRCIAIIGPTKRVTQQDPIIATDGLQCVLNRLFRRMNNSEKGCLHITSPLLGHRIVADTPAY